MVSNYGPRDRWLFPAAVILVLPPFILPLYNPDLFWHLSSARWIIEHAAFPREDFLSFTKAGEPWTDFEWLSQLILYGAHRGGGLAALWLLKNILLLASLILTLRTLDLYGARGPIRAAAMAVWGALNMAHSDIRPDLFSKAIFSGLFLVLERDRLRGRSSPALWGALPAVFAVWANLHAAFPIGLALLGCYALSDALEGRRRQAAARAGLIGICALATAANPYGLGAHEVLLRHWAERDLVVRYIQEWGPTTFTKAGHLPFWPALAAVLGLLAFGGAPAGPAFAVLYLGYSAANHTRLGSYFAVPAIPLIALLAGRRLPREPRAAFLALALALAGYQVWALGRVSLGGVFDGVFVPRGAAEFLDRERSAFERLRVYNPWEWGGYLGWRLAPWHKVFGDGRYIFHQQLPEVQEAVTSPGNCRRFLERRGLGAALVRNYGSSVRTVKKYRDGSEKVFWRPWYLSYFPREDWALAYWDRQALLFVRRAEVDPGWLSAREYRYVRPGDDAAFEEAIRLKDIPLDAVDKERARHERDLRDFAWMDPRLR